MRGVYARVVELRTGETMIEQTLDNLDLVEAQAELAYEVGHDRDRALEIRDPGAELWPSTDWVRLLVVADVEIRPLEPPTVNR